MPLWQYCFTKQPCHRTCRQVCPTAASCIIISYLKIFEAEQEHRRPRMARPWSLVLLGLVVSLVVADGIYGKKSPVLQVNAKNYGSLIAQSNHTSVR